MAEVLALVRGVDRDGHRPAQDRAPPGEHRLRLSSRRASRRGRRARRPDPDSIPAMRPPVSATSAADTFVPTTSRYSPSGSCSSRRCRSSMIVCSSSSSIQTRSVKVGCLLITVERRTCSRRCRAVRASGRRSRGLASSDTTAGSSAWYAEISPLNRRASTSGSPLRSTPPRWPRRNSEAWNCIASS